MIPDEWQLRLLCHPNAAEAWPEKERIDRFVRYGLAVADALAVAQAEIADLKRRLAKAGS